MLNMYDNKALFDYWHDRVRLKNKNLITSPNHVQTHILRHECTNYDDLWRSSEVQSLEEPERSRVVAVIKYQCTAQVLQNRAGHLREHVYEIEKSFHEQERNKSRLLGLIKALQEKLFGKDRQIENLKKQISVLKVENETLRTDAENRKAEEELREELESLQKEFDKVQKRRKELARNNQSLGGRVAHTKRYKNQRDEAREIVEQQKDQIKTLKQENQSLQKENQKLQQALKIK